MVTLETVTKTKVTCTTEKGAGSISGPREVAGVTLQFTGRRCTGTEPVVATADAAGAVVESNETDNVLTVACPIVGTNSSR